MGVTAANGCMSDGRCGGGLKPHGEVCMPHLRQGVSK